MCTMGTMNKFFVHSAESTTAGFMTFRLALKAAAARAKRGEPAVVRGRGSNLLAHCGHAVQASAKGRSKPYAKCTIIRGAALAQRLRAGVK